MAIWNSTLKPGKPLVRKKPMARGRAPKMTANRKPKARPGHDASMLKACRGEECHLQVPGVCLGAAGRDTVVPCHSNQGAHGKGMGLKADDKHTVPGCMACHAWLDQGTAPKREKFATWDAAYARWEPARARKMNQKQNPAGALATPGFVSAHA